MCAEEQCISQVLFSPFADGLQLLSYSEIKQQGEKAPAPPTSHMAQHNSGAVLWVSFAGDSGEELTEPWPHLPPPPPVLHPQELGHPVVWQELCKHVPHSASHCLPPLRSLQERKHCSWESGRGFPWALMKLASFTHLQG